MYYWAFISRERAFHFLIRPSYGNFPLRFVTLHLFVLGKFDCGGCLIFRRAAGNFLLHGVAEIHQHLTKTMEPSPGFLRIFWNGSVSRYENVGGKGFDRIQRL